jgi:hypothetical protein
MIFKPKRIGSDSFLNIKIINDLQTEADRFGKLFKHRNYKWSSNRGEPKSEQVKTKGTGTLYGSV